MQNGKRYLVSILAVAVFGSVVAQQTGGTANPGPKMTVQQRVDFADLRLNGDYTISALDVEFEPGARTPVHAHGGDELVLVTEGELTLVMDKDKSVRTFKAGEKFTIPAGEFFQIQNNTNAKARNLVVIPLPKGATFSTPKP